MRIVITGATGYIGTRLTSLAVKYGHDVVTASRQCPSIGQVTWLFYDLSLVESLALPKATRAVIHLAANTANTNCQHDGVEQVAAQRLIKSAQDLGAKFIFVSRLGLVVGSD